MVESAWFDSLCGLAPEVDNLCRIITTTTTKRGLLLYGPSDCGKTEILRILQKNVVGSVYIDLAQGVSNRRVSVEQFLQSVEIHQESSLILLDHLELLVGASLAATSAVIDIIDSASNTSMLIGACASASLSALHSRLFLPNRFGARIELHYPSVVTRCDVIGRFLTQFTVIDQAQPLTSQELEGLVSTLGSGTQNWSVPAIHSLVISSCIASQTDACPAPLSSKAISRHRLLTALSCAAPATEDNPFASSLMPSSSTKPRLCNLHDEIAVIADGIRGSTEVSTRGVIICGPPGCGKSSLARLIAHECASTHRALEVSCAELVHKIVGQSEKRISDLFRYARQMAPSILILDDIDIIIGLDSTAQDSTSSPGFSRRTSHRALDRLLSCLLVEIDGIAKENQGFVVVIATASDINKIDKSLLRPGRLEEHVQLHLPDAQERLNLFRNFIVTLPTAMKDTEGFLATLSERSAGWTPAEIKHYVTEASMRAIRVHIESCSSEWTSDSSVVVTERDFS